MKLIKNGSVLYALNSITWVDVPRADLSKEFSARHYIPTSIGHFEFDTGKEAVKFYNKLIKELKECK
jgi:hypothetical protein